MKAFRKKVRIWLLIVAILMGMLTIPAYATSLNHVADNTGILSEYQMDSIEKEMQKLTEIKVAVVIKDAGSRTTDAYAYNVAKETYKDVFENVSTGVVIVYCDSLEGYKIGVYSKGEMKIDEKELKDIIEKSYSLYITDSLWIEGSINSCVEQLKEVETKNAETAESQTKESANKEEQVTSKNGISRILEYMGVYHLISVIFFCGIAVGAVCLWKYLERKGKGDDDND